VKIVVCVKRVPDTETRIRIGPDGRSIDPSGVKYVLSPYDEFALEAALRTREAAGEGEVVALSLGDASSGESLRSALAMGADRAVLLEGEVTADGLATAQALAAAVESEAADLVLLGIRAADDDQQQVGPMLGTLLRRPCITGVREFSLEAGQVVAVREVDGGSETVEAPLPAVLSITKGAFEPRYASLKGIMAAKRKPMDTAAGAAGASRLEVMSLELPPPRPAGRVVGEGPEAVKELVRLLRDEAKAV